MAYAHQPARPAVALGPSGPARVGTLDMPRRRGVSIGVLLLLLGIWGGIIPFIGPLFDYRMDGFGAWVTTWDRLWLNILPGIAALIGGVLLVVAADRLSATVGAWLALAGGIWFVVGPTFSLLWDSPVGTGVGFGTGAQRFIEQIGYFYGLGAVIIALSAAIWGRAMVRSDRDLMMLGDRSEAVAGERSDVTVAGREAPADDPVVDDPVVDDPTSGPRTGDPARPVVEDPTSGPHTGDPAEPRSGRPDDPTSGERARGDR